MTAGEPSQEDLGEFYEEAYADRGEAGDRLGGWRAVGARIKADHVVDLSVRLGAKPRSVVEVGCGDGALLAELAARRFAPALAGFEISATAVAIVRGRDVPGLERIDRFDGARLPADAGRFDLGILSHVLEHVPEPALLLAEVARACDIVIVEVPLEANISARRASKRLGAEAIGHLQALDRGAVRELVKQAGLQVAADLSDPLPRAVHGYFAETTTARARAHLKAAARRMLFTLAPRSTEKLFTVHYACACVSLEGRSR